MLFEFKGDHGDNLPTVRITKIVLDNFKSVKHGEVVFHCGKHFVPYDTKSDILGVYGQNGSGKTSLIEAIGLLRYTMKGVKIPDSYTDCISKWSDHSRLSFTFDFQYPDGRIRKVVYSFSITIQAVHPSSRLIPCGICINHKVPPCVSGLSIGIGHSRTAYSGAG